MYDQFTNQQFITCIFKIFFNEIKIFYSNGTTESQQLHKTQRIGTTLSIILESLSSVHITKFIGIVSLSIEYFCLTKPITHSTCILDDENCLDVSTSTFCSCFFFLELMEVS